MEFHGEVRHKSRDPNEIKENSKASCSRPKTKLRDFLMSDKPAVLYADFHHEIIRNAGLRISKSSVKQQSHVTRVKVKDNEMVRHISKLPSHLEEGKRCQEKTLTVSSLEWTHLGKLYKHEPMPTRNNGYSPSTSSSSYFSTDGSSSHSSRGNTSSPGHQSHLEASPVKKNSIQDECCLRKGSCTPARQRAYHADPQFEDVNSSRRYAASTPSHMLRQQKLHSLDQSCATNLSETGKQQKIGNLVLAFPVKGKMRIQESELKKEITQSHEPNLGECNLDCSKEPHRPVLLLRDASQNSRSFHLTDLSASYHKVPGDQRLKSLFQEDDVKEFHSDFHSSGPYSCPLAYTNDGNKQPELIESCSMATTKGVNSTPPQFKSPSRSRSTVDMKLMTGLKSSSVIKLSAGLDKISGSKVRQPSPIRRLSTAVGSFIRSAGSRDNSPLRRSSSKDSLAKPELHRAAASKSVDESCTGTSQGNGRAKSSPLKRLLDPLLKSKAPNAREVAPPFKKDSSSMVGNKKTSDEHLVIAKPTFGSGRTKNLKQGSSLLQALLQVSVKNGLPLFTFAVDNDSDILAATPRKSSAPGKNCSSWIYTFFTVHESKRKNGLWMNHGNKGNGHRYVPNVIAQMKASNTQFTVDTMQTGTDVFNLREFTLFSVDTDQVDQHATEFHPTNELAAIVAKILKPASDKLGDSSSMSSIECPLETSMDSGNSQSLVSTTVILPGGVHTIPSKGSLSTLIQRWRSGGSCDCGGWDEGCQLRIFNQDECEKSSNLLKTAIAPDEFKLFSQVGRETQLVLSLKPYKDRIYSVEFSSSIPLLQAFGTSVAILDSRRSSGLFDDSNADEGRASTAVISDDPFQMKVVNQSQGEAPKGHVSYPPPHSPVGRV